MSRTGAFVVSGSGSGIGLAIAHKLVAEGHAVFGVGRNLVKLRKASQELGASFKFASADLSDPESAAKVVLQIREWLLGEVKAPLLGLVNNAGVFDRLAFQLTSDTIWERHFQNNLLSAVRLTRDLHQYLKSAAPSSVLNISSTLGLRPIPATSAYSAMKAAMISWTKTLALEWAQDKIRVNCLCPGLVDTPIHPFFDKPEQDGDRVAAHQLQPLARMGAPAEIAAASAFLLSEQSAWTTGSVLVVDGGISL